MDWKRFTPRASTGARLAFAAFLWTAVGIGLLVAGLLWMRGVPWMWLEALPLAALVGFLKGRFLLAPRIVANARRIEASDDAAADDAAPDGGKRCLFSAFGWGSWGLALLMMTGGAALRHSSLSRVGLGLLYTAVGSALLTASVFGWKRWANRRAEENRRCPV